MRYCLFAVLMLSAACSVDRTAHGGNKATCATGREACVCYPNATCNGDLTCVSSVCVDLGGSAGAGAGTTAFAGVGGAAAGSAADEDGGLDVEPDSGLAEVDSGADAAVALPLAHTLLVGVWSVTGGCPPVAGKPPETWTIDADYTVTGVKSQGWIGDVLYGAGDAMFHLTGPDSWEGTMSYPNVQTMMQQYCSYTAVRKQ